MGNTVSDAKVETRLRDVTALHPVREHKKQQLCEALAGGNGERRGVESGAGIVTDSLEQEFSAICPPDFLGISLSLSLFLQHEILDVELSTTSLAPCLPP